MAPSEFSNFARHLGAKLARGTKNQGLNLAGGQRKFFENGQSESGRLAAPGTGLSNEILTLQE